MEKFACKDLGLDCNFTATGATRAEVRSKAMQHGGVVHADLMKNMTKEQSAAFTKKLDSVIKTA